jgi:hypothetical protein
LRIRKPGAFREVDFMDFAFFVGVILSGVALNVFADAFVA